MKATYFRYVGPIAGLAEAVRQQRLLALSTLTRR